MKEKKYFKACAIIVKYLQQNPDVAWVEHTNIAEIALCSGGTKLKSHENTSKYMAHHFGVDTSKLPEYQQAIKRDMGKKNVWDNT